MPANLATTNGHAAMAYFSETPWHGLGVRLNEPASAAEAIEAAGLNYEVEMKPVSTPDGVAIQGKQAVVRQDTKQPLGIVGNAYQPIQNHQCFGFLDAIVGEGRLHYHTAGALGQGERIWMLAKLDGEIRIRDSEDVTEKFLLLSNSHDGTSSLRVFFTPIRVVCSNTLAMAERRGRRQGVSIAHKGNLDGKIAEAQEILGFARRFYDGMGEKIDRLASYYPTRTQLADYFRALYPDDPETKNRRAESIRTTLERLFESGRGQEIPETRRTMWSAFNAVTEYVDYHRPTRGISERQQADSRLKSAWFGAGARLKAEAWRQALHCSAN